MPITKRVNKDFFKTWTPEMAYVLGFFFADGSHDVNPRGSEYLSFQITDKDLLQTIKRVMGSDHKLAVRAPRVATEAVQYRLQIGSKEMCADLRSMGVITQKAQTMVLPRVPKSLFCHFVRGYFDGDGHVWTGAIHKKRKTAHTVLQTGFTSASKGFLTALHKVLSDRGVLGGSLYCKKRAFCIKYSTFDSLKLYDLMYGQLGRSTLYLPRKKKVFERFKQNCGGSSTG